MALITQPNLIEQSDMTTGWTPDGADEATNPAGFPDISNLLLDRQSQALLVRDGFDDLGADFSGIANLTASHAPKQVQHVNLGSDSYLVVIFSNGLNAANNRIICAVETSGSNAVTRIDTAGVTWSHPDEYVSLVKVDNVLYGSSRGNLMFSWDGSTYDNDCATPNSKTWVDATGGAVTPASQYGRDFAFTTKEFVDYSSDVYKAATDIRYRLWKSTEHYSVGDKVSIKLSGEYMRSYKCIKNHDSSTATTRPDDGSAWSTYWKRVRLDDIVDDDGDTTADWTFVPQAPRTNITVWHADRLWGRADGTGDGAKGRVQYSAPLRIDKGKDIADVDFNPKDWAPGDDLKGPGGGWLSVEDGAKTGQITALRSFGQYLLVFKKHQVWAISGYDDQSWNVRRLSRVSGCVSARAHVEHDGLVYFLGEDGLYVTDGTAVQAAPGNEKVQQWFRRRLDSLMTSAVDDGNTPWLFNYKGFIGIAVSDQNASSDVNITVFYDPGTQSFWKTDLPIRSFSSYAVDGVQHYCFVAAPDAPGNNVAHKVYDFTAGQYDDDDGTAIFWYIYTAWLPFGTAHEERRIRRVWWIVKPENATLTLEGYDDWDNTSAEFSVTRTPSNNGVAQHVEGAWMKDSHAVQLYLDGDAGGGKVYGFSIDTEPRRVRYHRG